MLTRTPPAPRTEVSTAEVSISTLEWLRRALASAGHDGAVVLAAVMESLASVPHADAVLADPWTDHWIATAVRLVDRDGLALLPDGQVRAHFAAANNLVAALRIGRAPIHVRIDEHGLGHLPGTGAVVRAGLSFVGRSVELGWVSEVPAPPDPTWPAVAACVQLPTDGSLVLEASGYGTKSFLPHLEASGDGDRSDERVADCGGDVDEQSDQAQAPETPADQVPPRLAPRLTQRWLDEGGAMADHPTSVEPAPPPPPQLLLALLEASAISAIVHPNRLGGPKIREDASFDQLSLLSVRQPDAFAALMDAASEGDDPVTRRVRGHGAYISRRYLEAADLYAGLLIESPGDTDRWRDLCWSLRHAGREEVVRTWVLHPAEVVGLAEAVEWRLVSSRPAGLPTQHAQTTPLTLTLELLEWIADDLRTR